MFSTKNGKEYEINQKILTIPNWYKISEILPKDFLQCCEPIYNILEGKHESKSTEDPFLKGVLIGHYDMTDTDWDMAEEARLKQKVLEMKMGDFHEELIGKFPGYETLPNGHHTECDVQKKDGSVIIEIKNKFNTIKGSDGKHIINRLKKLKEQGKHAILVQINCPVGKVHRYGASLDIDIWNGKEIYSFLSGRKTFFDDLQLTIEYVFSNYKTYESLKKGLEIV